MRHVRDRDDQPEAARLVRIGFGEHRIIEVARVGPVDGDQLQIAQIGAATRPDPARGIGLAQRRLGKHLRNVVRVDGNQADRTRIAKRAEFFQHPRRLQAQMQMLRQRFGQHDVVGRGATLLSRRHDPLGFRSAIGRDDPVLGPAALENPQDAAGRFADPPQRAAFIAARPDRPQPYQNPLPRSQRRHAALLRLHQNRRRRPVAAFPFDRTRHRVAVTVGAGDLNHHGIGQCGTRNPDRRAIGRAAAVPRDRLASMLNTFCH